MPVPVPAVAVVAFVAAVPAAHPVKVRHLVDLPRHSQGVCVGVHAGMLRVDAPTPVNRAALARAVAALNGNPDNPALLTEANDRARQAADQPTLDATARKLAAVRRAAAEKAPADPDAHSALAGALFAVGNTAGAEAAARTAVRLGPKRSDAWKTLAWVLVQTYPDDATGAMGKAAALAPDDVDVQLERAMHRSVVACQRLNQIQVEAQVEQAGGIRLPGSVKTDRAVVRDQITTTFRDVDESVRTAAARLKAGDGQCGLNTRDRCLGVLYQRDVVRMMARAAGDWADVGPITGADTLELVRDVVPATSDDPARVFVAAFIGLAARPLDPERGFPRGAPDSVMAYVHRLKDLSAGPDPAAAATAAFLHGVTYALFLHDLDAAEPSLREAVRLAPTFDLAWGTWVAMRSTSDPARMVGVAREWVAKSGSAESHYCLAKSHALAGDWPAVEPAVAAGLAKFPDHAGLRLCRAACLLKLGTNPEALEQAAEVLVKVHPVLFDKHRGDTDLWAAFTRLSALWAALAGQPASGRHYAADHARVAANPAEAKAIMALFPDPAAGLKY